MLSQPATLSDKRMRERVKHAHSQVGQWSPHTNDSRQRLKEMCLGAAEGEVMRGGVMEDDDARDTWRDAVIGPAFNLILTIGQAYR